MNWKNTTDRYGPLSIGMHWLMLLVMIGVYAVINLHDLAPKGSALRADLKTWHFLLGLSVLVLVVVRLATRLFSGTTPRIVPEIPRWQHRMSALIHGALYLFMIGMLVLGWFVVSAGSDPILFFGMPLPALVGQDKALYKSLKEIHETIGTVGYYLIGAHAAAALFHHYVMRDNTMLRMLPARR